jgi:hypothetical protein
MEILDLGYVIGALLLAFLGYKRWQDRKSSLEKKLDTLSKLPVRKWDRDFLQSKRAKTDPVADQVIAQIIENGELDAVNKLMEAMTRNEDVPSEGLPDEVIAYFNSTHQLPHWADPDIIKYGEKVYLKHGGSIAFLLMFKSLPECYACAKGVEVLYRTGRLNEQHGSLNVFSRRIAETAQFVVNALSPNGMAPRGKGVVTAQKIRLIHASIRYYLTQSGWDKEKYDEPINQEDMAGTLMSFSALVLEGLDMMGIELTQREKEAYVHCWRVMGYLMGLDEDLLPRNAADALALGHAILDHQIGPSEGGKVLTKALIDFAHQLSPGTAVVEFSDHMMRYLVTDPVADLLGVPAAEKLTEADLAKHTKEVMQKVEDFEKHSAIYKAFAAIFTKSILEGMLVFFNQGKRIHFYIPPDLQREWLKN